MGVGAKVVVGPLLRERGGERKRVEHDMFLISFWFFVEKVFMFVPLWSVFRFEAGPRGRR